MKNLVNTKFILYKSCLVLFLLLINFLLIGCSQSEVVGQKKKWHMLTINFFGPQAKETDTSPNPFLDFRLTVNFTSPSGKTIAVPGFFDGSGNGKGEGNVWKVRFTPPEKGKWQFKADFRKGPLIALDSITEKGTQTAFSGETGTFFVEGLDPNAPGFLRRGRLGYAKAHYLKFSEGGYWVKGGTDSPENFLAYSGFDNTEEGPFGIHHFKPHIKDWHAGDPYWGNGKGKGIIGALNYLASQKVNSIYLLLMNIGGDGKDVWPYVGPINGAGAPENDNLHFDVSKLSQWEIVFTHAQKLGIFLHFVLNEAEKENKLELDSAKLGKERKLFYREMIARFSHHLAIQWNLCEEYNISLPLPVKQIKEFAQYIESLDPYNNPITVHHAGKVELTWAYFLRDPWFPVASFQTSDAGAIERFLNFSRNSGRPLVIGMDEFTVDAGQKPGWLPVYLPERYRKEKIWPYYFSGAGMEFILEDLLKTENFKKYEKLWGYTRIARKFIEDNMPFWEMKGGDSLLTGTGGQGKVFMKKGEIYAIYLPKGGPGAKLDLRGTDNAFEQKWFNPRSGVFENFLKPLSGGTIISLGLPPGDPQQDWVCLINKNQVGATFQKENRSAHLTPTRIKKHSPPE